MWTLIISMVKDAQGVASSKRGAMLWCLGLFSAVLIVNLATGGRVKLDPTLQTQLFELVILTLALVFGEPFMKAIAAFKSRQLPGAPPPAP